MVNMVVWLWQRLADPAMAGCGKGQGRKHSVALSDRAVDIAEAADLRVILKG